MNFLAKNATVLSYVMVIVAVIILWFSMSKPRPPVGIYKPATPAKTVARVSKVSVPIPIGLKIYGVPPQRNHDF